MNRLDIIISRINALPQLAFKEGPIFMDDVRAEFRKDLQNFIFGETLSMQDGKLVIGKNLYKHWLHKLTEKGFDEEIHFLE